MLKKAILTLAFTAVLSTGYAQKYFYTAKGVVIPGHDAKNELYVSAGWGGGIDVNVSYSLSKNFNVFAAVTENEGNRRRFNIFRMSYIVKDNEAYTGGIGYFKPIKGKWFTHFETMAGFGKYQGDNELVFPVDTSRGRDITTSRYNSFFVVATLLEEKKDVQAGFSTRLAYSVFSVLTHDFRSPYGRDTQTFTRLRPLTLEPVAVFGFYIKDFTFQLQAGAAFTILNARAHMTSALRQGASPYYWTYKSAYGLIGRAAISYKF